MAYAFVWIVNMLIINWVVLHFKRSLRGEFVTTYIYIHVLSSAFKRTTGNQGLRRYSATDKGKISMISHDEGDLQNAGSQFTVQRSTD